MIFFFEREREREREVAEKSVAKSICILFISFIPFDTFMLKNLKTYPCANREYVTT